MTIHTPVASPPSRSIADDHQLALCLATAAQRFPDKTAIMSGGKRLSYREFDAQARRLAHRLIHVGVAPGDRVALHMLNGVDLAISYFGCFYAGAIAVPINPRLRSAEIRYVLEHSRASLYLGQPELVSEIAAMAPTMQRVRAFVLDVRLFAAQADRQAIRSLRRADPDEPAVILYTSGSTARPKGVTHTHRTALEGARSIGIATADVVAVATLMAHGAGFMTQLACVDAAATAVIAGRLEAHLLLDNIAAHRCTRILAMPTFCQELVAAQSERPRDVSSLQHCVAGGDAIPAALTASFAQAFGQPLCETYAMTELGAVAVNGTTEARLQGSVGRVLPHVQVDVAGATGDRADAVGELRVRSPSMMVGYWDDPDATAAALQNGWLWTGDLFRRDPEGYLWFAGRRKDIIVRGGSNISPQEVEAVLYEHDGVAEAGVVGAPDPTWGERVVAFVSRASARSVGAEELIAFARARLADYKAPERIFFLDALPKNPVGKVARRTLREMLAAGEGSGG
jgi:long-chain acyl-CoA synthetase